MIRVFVINKRSIFINALRMEGKCPDIEFIGICEEPLQAVKQIVHLVPDIIMVDANFQQDVYGISTKNFILYIRKLLPAVKLIAVSTYNEWWVTLFLKDIFVEGYFYRSSLNAFQDLMCCIRKVYQGEIFYL